MFNDTFLKKSDFTFVFQGGVESFDLLNKSIDSVKKYYPDSPIIVSTWNVHSHFYIKGVRFVFNEDPGGIMANDTSGMIFNINRQIISSVNGLLEVNTKYAIKLRTDSYLANANLLKLYLSNHSENNTLLKSTSRILVIQDWFLNPWRNLNMPFHMSDFLILGETKDVLSFFPEFLITENSIRWFKYKPKPLYFPKELDGFLSRFAAEQTFFMNFLRGKGVQINMDCGYTASDEVKLISEEYIRKYLIVVPSYKIGLKNHKHRNTFLKNIKYCYSNKEIDRIMRGGNGKSSKIDLFRLFGETFNHVFLFKEFMVKNLKKIGGGFVRR